MHALYANTFYSELLAPKSAVHHYNKDETRTASKEDFSFSGAISNDIEFMVYIGHGISASNGKGNYLHYNCANDGTSHTRDCANDIYNVYSNQIHFGSSESHLRWVWLYTCNFLKTGEYVSQDDLKGMMNGVHIVMGYATRTTLCVNVAEYFATELCNGETIINAFKNAGTLKESYCSSETHTQRILYIEEALNETIFSPAIYYNYDSEDILILENTFLGLRFWE